MKVLRPGSSRVTQEDIDRLELERARKLELPKPQLPEGFADLYDRMSSYEARRRYETDTEFRTHVHLLLEQRNQP
jgi:hypothetical protein